MFRDIRYSMLLASVLASMSAPICAQAPRARIVTNIDENRLTPLPRNTHPLARSEFDRGAAPDDLPLSRMLLVLTHGVDRQQSLDLLLKALQDKSSSQYHKWLTPQQFGERFGAADADINRITAWLASHGFQVSRVSNGRSVLEFSGTAGQVRQAFHTEIHKYVVKGKAHWANATDPEIPVALAPVIAGVSTLYNFRKAPQIARLKTQVATVASVGSHPQFTGSGGTYALAPGDFATIYNVNPVYTAGINGTGTSIAVVSRTNISLSDIANFRSSFALPNNPPQIVLNGTDPGDLGDGDEAEAVLDTSWSGAVAPSATVKLVISASTNTTDGVDLSEQYIIDHNLADVMTESYGDCEANYTQAEAQFYSSLAEQAASEGITFTVASGDSGAEGCDDPASKTVATGPVSVNILAATPYDIAVGGTQLNENGNPAAYWSSTNSSSNASALSYIPEDVWNESCTVASCGSSNAGIWAGAGGASVFFTKPSWQTGVSGIPNDGARDLPDVSFSSASHDFYLLCLDGSCTERHGRSSFSGVSGTSAATPSFAGIMALLVQAAGGRQGQADPKLYALAANETLSSCNASYLSALPAATCIFNDVTAGNNAVPGQTGYGTSAAVYQAGVGYDLATGLGSINVYNLFAAWSSTPVITPAINIGFNSPSSMNSSVIGLATFNGWALTISGTVTSVAISVDSVPYGNATYGVRRTDVCSLYSSANCPNVGWSFLFDTTAVSSGPHTLAATVTTSTGGVYTSSSGFTVANWTSANPMKASIDSPNANSPAFGGVVNFGGWAIDTISAISQISVTIDGVPSGLAQYGADRSDVCSAHPGEAACPYVGWNFALNTTTLADGIHTFAITPLTTGGQASTFSAEFVVSNNPGNVITISIDQPGTQSSPFSGNAAFGGWAITTTVPISNIALTIDGLSYGSAIYGGVRSDVCDAHPNRPSCPNVGWNFPLNTTSLVNGMHVLGITAYAGAGEFSTATRTFTVSNSPSASPIVIGIDSPSAQNAIVLGQTTFSGWAVNINGTLSQVKIAIDGVPAGPAVLGAARPDVCAIYPDAPACPNVGWNLSVDTARLANGIHSMTATAIGAQQNTLSSQFTVANWTTGNPMKLSIDYPNSQSGPLSGQVSIGGWVIDQLAGISNVSVTVDNLPLGNAFYGGARADVCSIFSGAIGCPNVGWNYYLDTTLLSDGTHNLAVTGATTGGQSSTFTQSFQIANSASSPLRVSIDAPGTSQTLTGIAPVGGWAVDTNGAQIVSVAILVDGIVNGTSVYGSPRADVCAHYPNSGGCPDVGWNYRLDTAPYANGAHTLEARALSADGKVYTQSTTFLVANQP
jgi:hypothetical protein